VVVTDGLYPATGQTAPLPDYLRLVRERDGYLVVDDTQALGILGKHPSQDAPYGRGGAGTPAWHGVEGPELIMGSSLAKGFGAPLAVIASNAKLIAKFEDLSATRVHSSPPSLAVISAARRALAVNEMRGDRLRSHLAKLERLYRRLLSFDVRAVLRSTRHMSGAALSFLITVLHTPSDIGCCMDALQHSCALVRHERGKRDHALSRAGSGIRA